MSAFEDFVNVELPLRVGISSLPSANTFPRFTGVGRVCASRTAGQVLSDIGAAAAGHTHVEANITDLQSYLLSVLGDTTPQLGGDLDTNARYILFDTARGLRDDSGNNQMLFTKIASAVNYFDVRNAAVAGTPRLAVLGSDANIHFEIAAKGTGLVKTGPLEVSGAITVPGGSVDGRDVAADGSKLDSVETNADITDAGNVASAGAVMDSDISPGEGFLRKTGAGAYTAHKSNLTAVVAPGVTDDSASGYSVSSLWIDVTADKVYVCVDASVGAAVWKEVSGGGGGGTPGGADTQLQYNMAGSFGGLSLLTFDGTHFLLGTGATTRLQFRSATSRIWSSALNVLDLQGTTINLKNSSGVKILSTNSSNEVILGGGGGGANYKLIFDGATNDGQIQWMEALDYFKFHDATLYDVAAKCMFREVGNFINSSATNVLDIVAPTINIGTLGTVKMGGGTLTTWEPDTTLMIHLGSTSKRINNLWADRIRAGSGFNTMYDTSNVSDPPTDANLDAAFGTPATLGGGFIGIVDDLGNEAAGDVWLVFTTATKWWIISGAAIAA